MIDHTDDLVTSLRMLMGSVAALMLPGIFIVYPFLVAGTAGALDLIALTGLAVITYWYLNPPQSISSRWLRRAPAPALQARMFEWLDAPVARQSVLSAWPPMLGVFAGRYLANGWTPPRGPMILYVSTLGLFATIMTVSEIREGAADDSPVSRLRQRIGEGLLWSASVITFLWLAGSMRGYFNPYY